VQTQARLFMERREHQRYRLRFPVIFSWRDEGQAQRENLGVTRDISTRGAFVVTTSPPLLNSYLKLKALIPPSSRVAIPIQILGEGRVVRVETIKNQEPSGGFALAAKRLFLRRGAVRGSLVQRDF